MQMIDAIRSLKKGPDIKAIGNNAKRTPTIFSNLITFCHIIFFS